VNVNPFDTGYHENSAVMEFAALASEVSTVTTKPVPPPRVATAKNAGPEDTTVTAGYQDTRKGPTVRQVRVSLAGMQGTVPVERVFEIIEGENTLLFCLLECGPNMRNIRGGRAWRRR
jgi:kinesin family member 20